MGTPPHASAHRTLVPCARVRAASDAYVASFRVGVSTSARGWHLAVDALGSTVEGGGRVSSASMPMSASMIGATCSSPRGAAPTMARSRPASTSGAAYFSSGGISRSATALRSGAGSSESSAYVAIGMRKGRSGPSHWMVYCSPLSSFVRGADIEATTDENALLKRLGRCPLHSSNRVRHSILLCAQFHRRIDMKSNSTSTPRSSQLRAARASERAAAASSSIGRRHR